MTALESFVVMAGLIFCRVGSCLMLAPGFGSTRVPPHVRVLIAVSLALALAPLFSGWLGPDMPDHSRLELPGLVLSEVALGGLLGLIGRLLMGGVQLLASLIASLIGLAGIPGVPLEDSDVSTPLGSLLSSGTTLVFFAAGVHLEILGAVADSYVAFPVGYVPGQNWFAREILESVAATTMLALRLVVPFIGYSVILNFSLGLASRFSPQLQVYFLSTSGILIGGLALLTALLPDITSIISQAYLSWFREGSIGP